MPAKTTGKGTDEEKQKILPGPSQDIEAAGRNEDEQEGSIVVVPETGDDEENAEDEEDKEKSERNPSRTRLRVEAVFRSIRLCKFLLYFNV